MFHHQNTPKHLFLKNFWRRPFGITQTTLPSVTLVHFVIDSHTGDRRSTQHSSAVRGRAARIWPVA